MGTLDGRRQISLIPVRGRGLPVGLREPVADPTHVIRQSDDRRGNRARASAGSGVNVSFDGAGLALTGSDQGSDCP
jgi:hypothetical protein